MKHLGGNIKQLNNTLKSLQNCYTNSLFHEFLNWKFCWSLGKMTKSFRIRQFLHET